MTDIKTIKLNDKYTLVSTSKFGIIAAFLLFTGLAATIGFSITDEILQLNYESKVGIHIQEAFNTVSPKASSMQLQVAIDTLNHNNLNHGYTNWIWSDKCGDIGFWYTTLQQAKLDVDSADYSRAWNPEAAKNDILSRHYNVLLGTYGDSMSPCDIQWGHYKYISDISALLFVPMLIIGIIMMLIYWLSRHMVEYGYDFRRDKVTKTDCSDYPHHNAGFFKYWKLKIS